MTSRTRKVIARRYVRIQIWRKGQTEAETKCFVRRVRKWTRRMSAAQVQRDKNRFRR